MVYYNYNKKDRDIELSINVFLTIVSMVFISYSIFLGGFFFTLTTFYVFIKKGLEGFMNLGKVYVFFICPLLLIYFLATFSNYFS